MHSSEILAVVLYFVVVLAVGITSYRKQMSATDFIIGGRSLNYWLTALAAHASDMSSWLFMGYPATIFTTGLFGIWTAIGLWVFMFLNWQFVAPKIRVATEKYSSLTFSSFFESRLLDNSGVIRVFTALMCFVFYSIYISAGLVGIGLLFEHLFNLNYYAGIFIGIGIIIPYVFIGGYLTLAWIDLFQGLFLLCVIVFVPLYFLDHVGGWGSVQTSVALKKLSLSILPSVNSKTWIDVFSIAAGWGLGYFGQPHIVTKFMGISNAAHIWKSKIIGMSWMLISLSAATLVGLVGIAAFKQGLADPEQVFIRLVEFEFPPFVIGLMLCAVMAATINATSSQVLVLSSSLTEDFYKRIFRKNASSSELLLVSRLGVVLASILAFTIAYGKISSIYSLVLYAWSGLGSSFGPLLLSCLYIKQINKFGAWTGILVGGIVSASWPYFNQFSPIKLEPLIPGFALSLISIYLVSYFTSHKSKGDVTHVG